MKFSREKLIIALYVLFAKKLPQSNHFILAKKIRVLFAKIIMKNTGENINIEKGASFTSQVSINDYSGIGVNCEMNGPVTIGKYVNMGPEVIVYTRNHSSKRTDIIMQNQGYNVVKPVLICDDVWIGRRVIILPGVTIGKGAVIGAGSVVSKDIPPYSIAVGNPARVVKHRKDESY